jgi:hypothetical protein
MRVFVMAGTRSLQHRDPTIPQHFEARLKNIGFTPARRAHSSPFMPSTQLTFADRASHRAWLASQSALPAGISASATARFEFTPAEAPSPRG